MSSEPVLSLLAVCEVCWLKEHSKWEPESVDNTGTILMRLTGVDVPQKLNEGGVEVCCKCGAITISGIFELTDPNIIYFTDENVKKTFEFKSNLEDDDEEDNENDI